MIVGQKQREKLSLVFEFSLPYYFLAFILLYCFPPFLITVLHSSSLSECMQRSVKRFSRRRGKSLWFFARVSLSKWKLKLFSLSEWNGTCLQNMMDSCHELFRFFDNSPKRQKFLTTVIDAISPEKTKRNLKDLCKTRWLERHSTFETIFDLYEYIVITLNEICVPTNDDVRFYPNNEDWSWDAKTKTMANRLRHSMISFGHIFSFVCA